jgi:hypothetical protein
MMAWRGFLPRRRWRNIAHHDRPADTTLLSPIVPGWMISDTIRCRVLMGRTSSAVAGSRATRLGVMDAWVTEHPDASGNWQCRQSQSVDGEVQPCPIEWSPMMRSVWHGCRERDAAYIHQTSSPTIRCPPRTQWMNVSPDALAARRAGRLKSGSHEHAVE